MSDSSGLQAALSEYKSSLEDLDFNSKPMINVLTMLAEENEAYADGIVKVIKGRIVESNKTAIKLSSLYLLDSILKNVGGDYIAIISMHMIEIFSNVFKNGDEKVRMSLFKLRNTWPQYFPGMFLHELDLAIKKLDSNWPVAELPASASSIHINPRFLVQNEDDPGSKENNAKQVSVSKVKQIEHDLLAEEQRIQEQLKNLQEEQMRIQQSRIEDQKLALEKSMKQKQLERERVIEEQQRQIASLRLLQSKEQSFITPSNSEMQSSIVNPIVSHGERKQNDVKRLLDPRIMKSSVNIRLETKKIGSPSSGKFNSLEESKEPPVQTNSKTILQTKSSEVQTTINEVNTTTKTIERQQTEMNTAESSIIANLKGTREFIQLNNVDCKPHQQFTTASAIEHIDEAGKNKSTSSEPSSSKKDKIENGLKGCLTKNEPEKGESIGSLIQHENTRQISSHKNNVTKSDGISEPLVKRRKLEEEDGGTTASVKSTNIDSDETAKSESKLQNKTERTETKNIPGKETNLTITSPGKKSFQSDQTKKTEKSINERLQRVPSEHELPRQMRLENHGRLVSELRTRLETGEITKDAHDALLKQIDIMYQVQRRRDSIDEKPPLQDNQLKGVRNTEVRNERSNRGSSSSEVKGQKPKSIDQKKTNQELISELRKKKMDAERERYERGGRKRDFDSKRTEREPSRRTHRGDERHRRGRRTYRDERDERDSHKRMRGKDENHRDSGKSKEESRSRKMTSQTESSRSSSERPFRETKKEYSRKKENVSSDSPPSDIKRDLPSTTERESATKDPLISLKGDLSSESTANASQRNDGKQETSKSEKRVPAPKEKAQSIMASISSGNAGHKRENHDSTTKTDGFGQSPLKGFKIPRKDHKIDEEQHSFENDSSWLKDADVESLSWRNVKAKRNQNVPGAEPRDVRGRGEPERLQMGPRAPRPQLRHPFDRVLEPRFLGLAKPRGDFRDKVEYAQEQIEVGRINEPRPRMSARQPRFPDRMAHRMPTVNENLVTRDYFGDQHPMRREEQGYNDFPSERDRGSPFQDGRPRFKGPFEDRPLRFRHDAPMRPHFEPRFDDRKMQDMRLGESRFREPLPRFPGPRSEEMREPPFDGPFYRDCSRENFPPHPERQQPIFEERHNLPLNERRTEFDGDRLMPMEIEYREKHWPPHDLPDIDSRRWQEEMHGDQRMAFHESKAFPGPDVPFAQFEDRGAFEQRLHMHPRENERPLRETDRMPRPVDQQNNFERHRDFRDGQPIFENDAYFSGEPFDARIIDPDDHLHRNPVHVHPLNRNIIEPSTRLVPEGDDVGRQQITQGQEDAPIWPEQQMQNAQSSVKTDSVMQMIENVKRSTTDVSAKLAGSAGDAPKDEGNKEKESFIGVRQLFQKLVTSGVIKAPATETPVESSSTPPPKLETEDEVVPEVNFVLEDLKTRRAGVINALYTGTQCATCGLRFTEENKRYYGDHLDWHFRNNRRGKEGKKSTSRTWFYFVEQWLEMDDVTDLEEQAKSNVFEIQAKEEGPADEIDDTSCAVIGEDETCNICFEPLEQFWDESLEEWRYKNATRIDGKTFHISCYDVIESNGESSNEEEMSADEDNSVSGKIELSLLQHVKVKVEPEEVIEELDNESTHLQNIKVESEAAFEKPKEQSSKDSEAGEVSSQKVKSEVEEKELQEDTDNVTTS